MNNTMPNRAAQDTAMRAANQRLVDNLRADLAKANETCVTMFKDSLEAFMAYQIRLRQMSEAVDVARGVIAERDATIAQLLAELEEARK